MRNLALKAYTWAQSRTSEEGQTAIEYAVVVAAVSIVLIGLLLGFGTTVVSKAGSKVAAFVP